MAATNGGRKKTATLQKGTDVVTATHTMQDNAAVRLKKDGTPRKAPTERKKPERSPEKKFERQVVMILREFYDIDEDDIVVRKDPWGTGRTIYVRDGDDRYEIRSKSDLRKVTARISTTSEPY